MAILRQRTSFGPGIYRGHKFDFDRLKAFVDGTNRAIAAGVPIPLLKRHAPINAGDDDTLQFAKEEGAGWLTKVGLDDSGNIDWEAKDVPEADAKAAMEGTLRFTSPEFRQHYECEKAGVYTGPIIRHFAFTPKPGNPHQGPVETVALQEASGAWQFSEEEREVFGTEQLSEMAWVQNSRLKDALVKHGYKHSQGNRYTRDHHTVSVYRGDKWQHFAEGKATQGSDADSLHKHLSGIHGGSQHAEVEQFMEGHELINYKPKETGHSDFHNLAVKHGGKRHPMSDQHWYVPNANAKAFHAEAESKGYKGKYRVATKKTPAMQHAEYPDHSEDAANEHDVNKLANGEGKSIDQSTVAKTVEGGVPSGKDKNDSTCPSCGSDKTAKGDGDAMHCSACGKDWNLKQMEDTMGAESQHAEDDIHSSLSNHVAALKRHGYKNDGSGAAVGGMTEHYYTKGKHQVVLSHRKTGGRHTTTWEHSHEDHDRNLAEGTSHIGLGDHLAKVHGSTQLSEMAWVQNSRLKDALVKHGYKHSQGNRYTRDHHTVSVYQGDKWQHFAEGKATQGSDADSLHKHLSGIHGGSQHAENKLPPPEDNSDQPAGTTAPADIATVEQPPPDNMNPDMPPKATDRSKLQAVIAGLNQLGAVMPSDFDFEKEGALDILLTALNTLIKAQNEAEAEAAADEEEEDQVTDAPMPFAEGEYAVQFTEEELKALPPSVKAKLDAEAAARKSETARRKEAEKKALQFEEEKKAQANANAKEKAKATIQAAKIPPGIKTKLIEKMDAEKDGIQFAEGAEVASFTAEQVAVLVAAHIPPALQFQTVEVTETDSPKMDGIIGYDPKTGQAIQSNGDGEQFFEGGGIPTGHVSAEKARELVKNSPFMGKYVAKNGAAPTIGESVAKENGRVPNRVMNK